MAQFEPAIEFVLMHEGGHVDDPNDPGGDTWYGITRRDHPSVPWPPSRDQAIAIYKTEYWGLAFERIINQRVANKILDMEVNLGFSKGVSLCQRAIQYLGAKPYFEVDGLFGPNTVDMINSLDPDLLLEALRAYHAMRYIQLVEGPDKRFQTFSKGWLRRAMA